MLRIRGSQIAANSSTGKLCRREWLHAGALGLAGVSLPGLLAANSRASDAGVADGAGSAAPGFGAAKNCILIYLYGAPSQLETFDMKPTAPVEIRGTMQPIPSTLPGLSVCEHLPLTAGVMDRVSVVRSVTHPYPIHGVAFATSGVPVIDTGMELSPNDPRHHPYFGSVVAAIDRQNPDLILDPSVPQNVALPFPFSSQRTGEVYRAGPYPAYLGAAYSPVWTEFVGSATRTVQKTLNAKIVDVADPYLGCSNDSHFRFATTAPPAGITLDRLNTRRSLLQQFDAARAAAVSTAAGQSLDRFQQMAFNLIQSPRVSEALDVRREPAATQDLYGRTLFGQSCLAARRMIEAGTRLVSVFWDEYGLAGDAWDTHWNHYPRMVDQLLPSFDIGFSGLIRDLDSRGMLDETLVVVLSDHGRTPQLNSAAGGGRDHWSQCYSLVLAGGGIAHGKVIGASDRHAAFPVDNPVGPKDILATMYHCLGIAPHRLLPDRSGTPTPLVPESARVVNELLA